MTKTEHIKLAIQMLDQPMKITNEKGEEEITTLRKEWPKFRKKLKI